MENIEKAYKEIFKVLNKHKDLIVFDISNLEQKSKLHLLGLELRGKYGLNIDTTKINSLEWNRFGDYLAIGMYGEDYRRTISWSDDGSQPENELLLVVSFPTGAYIFGDDYPVDLFKDFFNELSTFAPKYSDTTNKCLYFSMDNAKNIFNSFYDILNKYKELNRQDFNRRKIERLKKEIEKLEK